MNPAINQDIRAIRAQQNDAEMNRFVEGSKTFILRCASRTCKRFITESDDEFEIAMVAFWEAVQKYDATSGNFDSFAALVIRRRLMDFFDSQSRQTREIVAGHSMTWEDDEVHENGIIAEVQKVIVRDAEKNSDAIREEIEALGDILKEYGFTFFDLAEASPKAAKTKKSCARAVNWMLATAERVFRMRKSKSLPVKTISAALNIAQKILERHRRYIIASTEILDGDYPFLSEYVNYIRKERLQ